MREILIHNAAKAFLGVSFPGIRFFSDRPLVIRDGVAVVLGPYEDIQAYHQYLLSLGLGGSEVICTEPGQDLYDEVMGCTAVHNRVFQLGREGAKLNFFNTTDSDDGINLGPEERVLESLSLPWSAFTSPRGRVADLGNNKARLRRLAEKYGLRDLFPPGEIVSGCKEVFRFGCKMIEKYGEVAIKQPFLATGIGMFFGVKETLHQALDDFQVGSPAGSFGFEDIIIEEAMWPHVSMTVVFRLSEGQIVDWWFSKQNCELNSSNRVIHEGSVVGKIPREWVNLADMRWLVTQGHRLLKAFLAEVGSFTGKFTRDALRHIPTGRRYFTEANVRHTLSSYLRAVQSGLALSRGVEPTCIMEKVAVRDRSLKDFEVLRSALGDLLLTRPYGAGVVPTAPRCIDAGYFYPVAVAGSYRKARATLDSVRERLS